MTTTPFILALNHSQRNLELLAEFLEKAGFSMIPANSLEDLDAALAGDGPISLALLDLAGFDSAIWERCDHLRRCGTPFLIISPRSANALPLGGVSPGTGGVLTKPLSPQTLLAMIRTIVQS